VIYPKCECGHPKQAHTVIGQCWYRLGPCECDKYRPVRVSVRRSPIQRASAPIKRNAKVRKKSKRPLRLVRDDVWALFAAYVKERDGNVCFSCGKGGLESQNWHAGHMFPSGNNAILRYEPKNVHSQCGRCNCFLSGNGAAYVAHFLEVYGLAELERINGMRGREKKWSRAELEEMGAALKRGGADFECWYAERYGLQGEA
jgi:hypothetical protein